MTARLLLLAAALSSSAVLAEAGLPAMTFCGQNSCTCGSQTCTCGQWCSAGSCLAAQAGYCTTDSQCAATCDSFICQGNVCVKGFRDGGAGGAGGSGGAAGGGSAGGGSAGGGGASGGGTAGGSTSATGGGSAAGGGGTQSPGGCGCTTVPPMFAVLAALGVAVTRWTRRRS